MYRYTEEKFDRKEHLNDFKYNIRGKVSKYGYTKLVNKVKSLTDKEFLKYISYTFKSKFFDISSDFNKGDKVISYMASTKSKANTFDLRSIFTKYDAEDIIKYINFLDQILCIYYDNEDDIEKRNKAINLAINSKNFLSIKSIDDQFRLLYEIAVAEDKEITAKLAIKEGFRFENVEQLVFILRHLRETINYFFTFADVYTTEDLLEADLSTVPVNKLR